MAALSLYHSFYTSRIPEEYWDIKNIRSNELVKDCHQDVSTKYNKYILESLHEDILKKNESAGIKIVYSAMHGVGYKYILDAFKAAKLKVSKRIDVTVNNAKQSIKQSTVCSVNRQCRIA